MPNPLFEGCAVALITPFRGNEIDWKALDQLVSQQYENYYDRKDTETWVGCYGFYAECSYAEAFAMKKPPVERLINVPEHWMIRANEPELDKRTRDCQIIAAKVPYEG